jgi:hypothetical protein
MLKRKTIAVIGATTALAVGAIAVGSALSAPTDATKPASRSSQAIVLNSFVARKLGPHTVTVHWRTTREVDLLGFNLYRRQAGQTHARLVERLLPAQDAPAGAVYAYADQLPKAAATVYRLQVVHANGAKAWLATTSTR